MANKSVFSAALQNRFSRNFGGTNKGVADPYLTGYFFVQFVNKGIFKRIADTLQTDGILTGMSDADIIRLLQACCTGVTPPGGTLTSVDFPGLGGIKWGVPGNVDYGNTVSVKFIELQGAPIYHIIHTWFKIIRDYRFGASIIPENEGRGYTKSTYATDVYYWTTSPDARSVEFAACYDGVYPTKDPQDLYSGDIETVGRLDVEIEFHLDYPWTEGWVYDHVNNIYAPDLIQSRNDIMGRIHTP